jgi:hypothetical protein
LGLRAANTPGAAIVRSSVTSARLSDQVGDGDAEVAGAGHARVQLAGELLGGLEDPQRVTGLTGGALGHCLVGREHLGGLGCGQERAEAKGVQRRVDAGGVGGLPEVVGRQLEQAGDLAQGLPRQVDGEGWTFANSAPKSFLTRSIARDSMTSTCSHPAVIPPPGIALGILVRQHRPLRLHDGERREVLRRDHLQRLLLATELRRDRVVDLGVEGAELFVEEVHDSSPRSLAYCT